MNAETFTARLRQEGYTEFVEVEREPNGMMDTHSHPFDAQALILSGEIGLKVGDEERSYSPGEIFVLAKDVEHVEHYGPQGVRYLVGRK